MLSAVEPCIAPMVKGNKSRRKLELVMARRKCIFVYHYFDDPVFGFGHVRIQSWLPFNIFICLNGRHWLEKQLQKEGIGYIKDGNCFPWIEDKAKARRGCCTGLVKKVAKENRYMLTAKGQKFACALMCASAVDIKGLTELAA